MNTSARLGLAFAVCSSLLLGTATTSTASSDWRDQMNKLLPSSQVPVPFYVQPEEAQTITMKIHDALSMENVYFALGVQYTFGYSRDGSSIRLSGSGYKWTDRKKRPTSVEYIALNKPGTVRKYVRYRVKMRSWVRNTKRTYVRDGVRFLVTRSKTNGGKRIDITEALVRLGKRKMALVSVPSTRKYAVDGILDTATLIRKRIAGLQRAEREYWRMYAMATYGWTLISIVNGTGLDPARSFVPFTENDLRVIGTDRFNYAFGINGAKYLNVSYAGNSCVNLIPKKRSAASGYLVFDLSQSKVVGFYPGECPS